MATQEPYMPIQVGKALATVDLGIQGDDTGDNISAKNRSYCELTSMYWAWKNLKNVDIIGLCHYRRYFDFHKQCKRALDIQVFKTEEFGKIDLSIPQSVIDGIRDGVAVVAKKTYGMSSLYSSYCNNHISDDIRTLTKIIEETQREYTGSFRDVMLNNNALIPCNMFIMTWHDFDEYCKWLFAVLAEAERRIDISHYNPVQMRVFGYMAERLFNVYLHAKEFKLKHHNIIWFNDETANPSTFHQLETRFRGSVALFFTREWSRNR